MKNGTEVTYKISLNVGGDSNDENNFPHKLLSTNKQASNGSSANVKLSKTQSHKMGLLGPLLKPRLPLIGNALKILPVSISLGLIAASATDAAIQKKMFRSGSTTLIISNV